MSSKVKNASRTPATGFKPFVTARLQDDQQPLVTENGQNR